MATLDEKVARLTDRQALSVVDSLSGEFGLDETPEAKEAQIKALEALFKREGHAADSDAAATAAVARRLLLMMAQVPEFRPSLDERLDHPPKENPPLIPGQPLALIFIGAALIFIPDMPPPSPRR